MNWTWLDLAPAAAPGGLVGASELISRYKDDPVAALKAWSGIFYIAINGAASMGALGLIRANGWLGPSRWAQILMAGVSAMAFFRTSLFVVRAGDRALPHRGRGQAESIWSPSSPKFGLQPAALDPVVGKIGQPWRAST